MATRTVKIGLDNWEVATLDDADKVTGTPTVIPGLTSAQLSSMIKLVTNLFQEQIFITNGCDFLTV